MLNYINYYYATILLCFHSVVVVYNSVYRFLYKTSVFKESFKKKGVFYHFCRFKQTLKKKPLSHLITLIAPLIAAWTNER